MQWHADDTAVRQVDHGVRIGEADALRLVTRIVNDWLNN